MDQPTVNGQPVVAAQPASQPQQPAQQPEVVAQAPRPRTPEEALRIINQNVVDVGGMVDQVGQLVVGVHSAFEQRLTAIEEELKRLRKTTSRGGRPRKPRAPEAGSQGAS